jgi:hypothetical protein
LNYKTLGDYGGVNTTLSSFYDYRVDVRALFRDVPERYIETNCFGEFPFIPETRRGCWNIPPEDPRRVPNLIPSWFSVF